MSYQERNYEVTFLTPAFLGDAEQSGRWRTPPFKAQLRQWWRVAYAMQQNFNVDVKKMRWEEGQLFGNAWLSHQGDGRTVNAQCKSLVRLQLDRWDEGSLATWEGLEPASVIHPEVRKTHFRVGAHAYLGYGPLSVQKVQTQEGGSSQYATVLQRSCAIQAGESTVLRIAYPEEYANLLEHALWLMHRYGTVGGRSRNGWGSFELGPVEGIAQLRRDLPLRDWKQCLELDWPHAIGEDENGPLIWLTKGYQDWKTVMRDLAQLKIGLRTKFRFVFNHGQGDKKKFKNDRYLGIEHAFPQERHWLAYPVPRHWVAPWEKKRLRLPNSLRFKVREENGKLLGVVYHMPCRPPNWVACHIHAVQKVWSNVHTYLDGVAARVKV